MKEQKTVLSTQVNGETAIVMPITKLECIEDTATSVDSASDTDYIPVIDSADEGQMKKITVKNFLSGVKTVAQNAQTAASEAKSAAQTAQEAASSAASASTPVAFSVAASAWTTLTSEFAGCKYKATITASSVTASDFPDVFFDSSSIEAASSAGIIASAEAGVVALYAKTKPESTLAGSYFIKKGAAS